MLKKALRLGRKDLERLFQSRTRGFYGKLVSIRALRNERQKNRFAFIVSGPKNRGAALRNLARRRMSEAAKSFIETMPTARLPVGQGRDVVFFMKLVDRSVPSFKEIKKDIEYVLAQNIF